MSLRVYEKCSAPQNRLVARNMSLPVAACPVSPDLDERSHLRQGVELPIDLPIVADLDAEALRTLASSQSTTRVQTAQCE